MQAIAFVVVRAVVLLGPASIPRLADLSVDMPVLAFGLAITLVTSIVCGLTPALAATGGSAHRLVCVEQPRRRRRGGTALAACSSISELAGAAMLLVAAGLLIRSYVHLQQVEPGFDPKASRRSASRCRPPGTATPRVREHSSPRCCRDCRRSPEWSRPQSRWVCRSRAI